MEIQEILRELEFNQGYFPRAAVEAAIEQREAITPHLLHFLEHACDNAEHLDDDADETGPSMGHIHAMYLLAQFRERAAYPLIVKLSRLPNEVSDELLGDVTTESLPNILASVCGGDTAPIRQMAEDRELSEWVRGAAVRAFLCLVAAGEMPREEAIAHYTTLFRGGLEHVASNAWDSLVSGAADLGATELSEDIDRAFEEGLADPFFASREGLAKALGQDARHVCARLKKRRCGLIEDAVQELAGWACFGEEPLLRSHGDAVAPLPRSEEPDAEDELYWPRSADSPPAIRAERMPGRNDPCPCGSGRKYKHCCARKPKEEA